MTRRLEPILALLTLIAPLGACARADPRRPPGTVVVDIGATKAAPTAPATADIVVSTPDVPAPGPGKIGCGAATCDARAETCCHFYDEAKPPRCVPRVAEMTTGEVPEWPLIEACVQPPGTSSEVSSADRCDASDDCGPSERCCHDHLGREHHQRHCSTRACTFVEVCSAIERCRTPGTRCEAGACRKVATISCAGVPCDAPERMCCTSAKLDDYACRPAAACDPFFPRIECVRPSDCPSGQDCALNMGNRSECRGGPHDTAATGVACVVDRDCAQLMCLRGARCVAVTDSKRHAPGVTRECVCK